MAPIDKLDVAYVITQTITALNQHAVPPTKLAVNEVEAASILGVDIHALRSDRREAKRDGHLKFRFRKWGGRVVYIVNELREDLSKLPHGFGCHVEDGR